MPSPTSSTVSTAPTAPAPPAPAPAWAWPSPDRSPSSTAATSAWCTRTSTGRCSKSRSLLLSVSHRAKDEVAATGVLVVHRRLLACRELRRDLSDESLAQRIRDHHHVRNGL